MSLAGEGRQALQGVQGAVGTPKPRAAPRLNTPHVRNPRNLPDEGRQTVSVAAVRDFPEEGLQVLADDGVEDGVFGVMGLIRARNTERSPDSSNGSLFSR